MEGLFIYKHIYWDKKCIDENCSRSRVRDIKHRVVFALNIPAEHISFAAKKYIYLNFLSKKNVQGFLDELFINQDHDRT